MTLSLSKLKTLRKALQEMRVICNATSEEQEYEGQEYTLNTWVCRMDMLNPNMLKELIFPERWRSIVTYEEKFENCFYDINSLLGSKINYYDSKSSEMLNVVSNQFFDHFKVDDIILNVLIDMKDNNVELYIICEKIKTPEENVKETKEK